MMDKYSSFSGRVVHGEKVGRTIGFPTLNIAVLQGNIPKEGVYIVKTFAEKVKYFGIMSIGNRPTFTAGELRSIEIHLLDTFGDFYDSHVEVFPLCFLRENKKFNSIDELKIQLHTDKDIAENLLNVYNNDK